MLARYQAIGCGAALFTRIQRDVLRLRFLWISVALGLAAAICAQRAMPA
jgi:hypothetical protein